MRIPVRKIEKLWHWGTLDHSQKRTRGPSYEGDLLSVSACPEGWCKICKFGGSALHKTNEPKVLLDAHEILFGKAHHVKNLRRSMENWGLVNGVLEMATVYQVEITDEDGEINIMLFRDEDQSRKELEWYEEDDAQMVAEQMLICTVKICSSYGFLAKDVLSSEYAIIEWAKTLDGIDGVYWDNHYDPDAMSAPRGGLFKAEGLVEVDDAKLIDGDEDLLQAVGERYWIDSGKALQSSPDDSPCPS